MRLHKFEVGSALRKQFLPAAHSHFAALRQRIYSEIPSAQAAARLFEEQICRLRSHQNQLEVRLGFLAYLQSATVAIALSEEWGIHTSHAKCSKNGRQRIRNGRLVIDGQYSCATRRVCRDFFGPREIGEFRVPQMVSDIFIWRRSAQSDLINQAVKCPISCPRMSEAIASPGTGSICEQN